MCFEVYKGFFLVKKKMLRLSGIQIILCLSYEKYCMYTSFENCIDTLKKKFYTKQDNVAHTLLTLYCIL